MEFWPSSVATDDEFEKLIIRMNPPSVTIDNTSSRKATLVKVDSANRRGSLLEVVQVLTDLGLTIRRAYVSSDGGWFMDVFHVTDKCGNKVSENGMAEKVQQSLAPGKHSFRYVKQNTVIELTGRDRPGLLSEVFAVLADLNCNVVAAETWTHNSRMATVVYITDVATGNTINNPGRLSKIEQLLLYVLKGNRDRRSASTCVSVCSNNRERRLHQMMYDYRDYEMTDSSKESPNNLTKPNVNVENCTDKAYTVVRIGCPDRAKLFFDTVCTLTDMQYAVYHATIIAEGSDAYQEYYIRHVDGWPVSSEAERQRLIQCLEAAIQRRVSKGLRLELCGEDRVGLLSDVTRIFRENGLSITRAEVTTLGSQAINVFYVINVSGDPIKNEVIEAIQKEIGLTVVRVRDESFTEYGMAQSGNKFSLGNILKLSSENFLQSLGFSKSRP